MFRIDPCTSNPCGFGGSCVSSSGSFTCTCPYSLTYSTGSGSAPTIEVNAVCSGDFTACEVVRLGSVFFCVDPCSSNVCGSTVTDCFSGVAGFVCECPGFVFPVNEACSGTFIS